MSAIRVLISLAVIIAAANAPLFAQATPSVNGRLLPVGIDTFTVSYAGAVIGHGIMARSHARDSQLLQVYQWRSSGGDVIVDSLFSDLGSLRPMREVRVVGDTVIEAAFRG